MKKKKKLHFGSDLLKRLCKKNDLPIEHYTLRLADTKTDIALDKTVGEANVSALCLMKKHSNSAGDIYVRPVGEKPTEEIMEARYSNMTMTEYTGFKVRASFFYKKHNFLASFESALF